MSEDDKDNKDFEFIKEQVIEKKHKKFKKWMIPFLMTVLLAIIFGLIAAVTFAISEPKLSKLLHKEEEDKTPICFPTEPPVDTKNPEPTGQASSNDDQSNVGQDNEDKEPVIVEQTIDANIHDYLKMSDEIRSVATDVNRSILRISSNISGKDWFGNPVERKVDTTGVVIGNNGSELLILVSLDRVQDASSIKVDLTDTVSVDAVLQDYDSDINLAVIAVKLADIPALVLNTIKVIILGESYTVNVGNPVLALGSPNGHQLSMEMGIVTSKGSNISITDNKLDMFNTDIQDNKNSDGIIVNMKGEVIGLITRTLKKDQNEELNTNISISKVRKIILSLANKSPRMYFGVLTDDMTDAAKIEHDVANGIYVNEVMANSPAFSAGIKNGDIILQIDDKVILNSNSFYETISTYQPGDVINVKIKRTSGTTEKVMNINVTLVKKER